MKKILYGVCGIGNGHTQRQLPLIQHFSKNHRIVIFAYDTSLNFYSTRFKDHPSVTVLEVAVPFYVGNKDGIDFEATQKLASNNKDYDGINGKTIATAKRLIGVPDIVITDYEPISAEYAYAHKVPLITIDQQSKYLAGEFPTELHTQTYADEVARLNMFFLTATARIACSFFDVVKKVDGEDVIILPPILKDSILAIENSPTTPVSILVYFSSQKEFPQTLEEVMSTCASKPEVQFHIFAPSTLTTIQPPTNVTFYTHGDERFKEILKNCSGIISTAGHTLLSEAMYLGIPVYAIPLAVYEQQMNAEVIHKNGFGVKSGKVDRQDLEYFLEHISQFRTTIKGDEGVLLRGSGGEEIIRHLESHYLS